MEDEQRSHLLLSEHENHGGYVCHRCSWPFPNPHPSAKHRRAHRKHCGNIDGFKLITDAPAVTGVKNGAADEDSSDDEHSKKPGGPVLPELKTEKSEEEDDFKLITDAPAVTGVKNGAAKEDFSDDEHSKKPGGPVLPELKTEKSEEEDGFKLITHAPAVTGVKNGAAKEDFSDDEHSKKPGGPVLLELKTEKSEEEEEERKSSECIEEGSSGVSEVWGPGSERTAVELGYLRNDGTDTEADNFAPAKTLELCDKPNTNESQGLGVQILSDHLENSIQFKSNMCFSSISRDTATEFEESSSFTHLKEAELLEGSVDIPHNVTTSSMVACSNIPGDTATEFVESSGFTHTKEAQLLDFSVDLTQNVVTSSMITYSTGVQGNKDANQVMDVTFLSLPGDIAQDATVKDLESEKIDKNFGATATADVSNAGGIEAKDILHVASVKMKVLDSKVLDEQMDTAGKESHNESSGFTYLKVDLLLDSSVGIPLNVVASSMISGSTGVQDNEDANRVMDVTPLSLPGDIATYATLKDLESEKLDENFEDVVTADVSNAGDIEAKDILDEASVRMHVLDSKVLDKQMDTSGQESHNELLSCPEEINACEHLDPSSSAVQIKGRLKEDLSALLAQSNRTGGTSEMNIENFKDHEPLDPNQSGSYAGTEEGIEPCHLGGTVLQVAQSEMLLEELDQNADVIPSSVQLLQMDTEIMSKISDLKDNLYVNNGHGNGKQSPHPEDVECEADITTAKFNVIDYIEPNDLKCYPISTITESPGAQNIGLVKPVTGPMEANKGNDTDSNSLNGVMLESHGEAADAGVSVAISQANEAVKIVDGSKHLSCEKNGVPHDGMVGSCKHKTSDLDSCHSETKVESEPRISSTEAELTSDTNKGRNEPERVEELPVSILYDSVLGSEGLCIESIDSGHLEISRSRCDKLSIQKASAERTTELETSNDPEPPLAQKEADNVNSEKEIKHTKEPLEELGHQQLEILHNVHGSCSDEVDKHELHGISTEPSISDCTGHSVTQTGVLIKKIESESNCSKQPEESLKLNESTEIGLYDEFAKDFGTEEHRIPLVDSQSPAQISAFLDNATSDASGDSNSQTDSVDGQWGSISDGAVLSSTHATNGSVILTREALSAVSNQTTKDLDTSNFPTKSNTDNMELFDESSMQPASCKVQSKKNSEQPSSLLAQSIIVQKSQERKKNVEIIEKVVNWDSGRPHTPLKSLLAEAVFETKQKPSNAQSHNTMLPIKKDPASKLASENSSEPSSNRADHKEWNSPARFPVRMDVKKKGKGKSTWVPFMCCSYVT